MALPTIETSNFTGYLKISTDTFVSIEFQQLINQKYPQLVREIVGDAAYVAMRDAVSLPDKWSDLMNGCEWLDEDAVLRINSGLTEICKHWLYWFWMRESYIVNTNTGNVSNLNENSRMATRGDNAAISNDRYNRGCDLLEDELLPFVLYFSTVSRSVLSVVDLGGGVKELTVSDTTYLTTGDAVAVDNVEYVADNVTATTFEITSASASFSSVLWYPFENLPLPRKERVFA